MIELPIGKVFENIVNWMTDNWEPFFDGINWFVNLIVSSLENLFQLPPPLLMIAILGALGWFVAGRGVGIFTLIGLFIVDTMNLWPETMQTLALVISSAFIALLIGIPLGIWAAKNNTVNKVLRPILDFMQTMPAFVYLIPAVLFFGLGKVPGAVATIIFSMPPVVRLTNLGIRQIPKEVIEASQAFGSTGAQELFKVEIPLATPTIFAGINQTIMLSLSMVVISSMIGAGGLGGKVLSGITQYKIGLGFESGIAVVILAMVLDRITQALGKNKKKKL